MFSGNRALAPRCPTTAGTPASLRSAAGAGAGPGDVASTAGTTARRPCRQVPTGHPDRANVPDRVNVTPGRASTTRAARRWTGEPGGTVRGIRRCGQQGGVGDTTGSPRHTGPADAGRSRGPVTGPAAGDVARPSSPSSAAEIRELPGRADLQARRAPRSEPGRRRADHGAAPGVRLARATRSCSTPVTRPTCTRSSPAGPTGSTRLRTRSGLSGYPSRAESEHDWIENSHASTSLSYADGLAKAFALRGETDRTVVAVIGDGALTGGMAWEALNNIAGGQDRPLVIVLNDNGRSYAPTTGGHGRAAGRAAAAPRLRADARPGQAHPAAARRWSAGRCTRRCTRRSPRSRTGSLPQTHVRRPRPEVRRPDRRARRRGAGAGAAPGPGLPRPGAGALRHPKGQGYRPAETRRRRADALAAAPSTRPPASRSRASTTTWTHVFGREMVVGRRRAARRRRDHRRDVRTRPGWRRSRTAFPDRVFDVGIAEQHALTSAAGLAMGGMHPVVAVYATFLNRAFDQLLMDCALHRLRRHRGAGPGRGHRRGRPQPPRHVGHVAGRDRARAADGRAAGRGDPGRGTARGAARSPTGRPCSGSPRAPLGRRPPSAGGCAAVAAVVDGVDILAEPPAGRTVTCCWSRSARSARLAVEAAAGWPRRASASPSSTRAGSLPVPAEMAELAARAPAGGHRRGRRPVRRGRCGGHRPAGRHRGPGAGAGASRSEFLEPGPRAELLGDLGLTAQAVARGITEEIARSSSGSGRHRGQPARRGDRDPGTAG